MSERRFSAELLSRLKGAVSIEEIVGEHVLLRKAGSNLTGLCPFHSERSPSFSVNPVKKLYHCYGCKAGGDMISFMMEIGGLSFNEAVEDLALRAGVNLPKTSKSTGDNPTSRVASKLNRFAAAFYHQYLQSDAGATAYLNDRGVGADLRRNFYLGAAPADWDQLTKRLLEAKAPISLAKQLGLILPSKKPGAGLGFFDLFRGRIVFPILDLRGRVAGFGGRLVPGVDENRQTPKYLNSPESFLFQKSRLAYGLYQAKKYVRDQDNVIVVEGYFDVLLMHSIGIYNVVATCGTSLTVDHLKTFQRFGKKVTLLFDGDNAGQEATERAMELGLDLGLIVHGLSLPAGTDPDEVARENPDRLREDLAAAEPVLDVRIQQVLDRAKEQGAEGRSTALKKVAAWLARLSDEVGREVRIEAICRKYSEALGMSRELIARAVRVGGRPPAENRRPTQPVRPRHKGTKPLGPTPADLMLIRLLARWDEVAQEWGRARRKLPPGKGLTDLFEHPSVREFTRRIGLEGENFSGLGANVESELAETDPGLRQTVVSALFSEDEEEVPADFLERAVFRAWARFSHEMKRELGSATSQAMKDYLDVQRKMKDFRLFYDQE